MIEDDYVVISYIDPVASEFLWCTYVCPKDTRTFRSRVKLTFHPGPDDLLPALNGFECIDVLIILTDLFKLYP